MEILKNYLVNRKRRPRISMCEYRVRSVENILWCRGLYYVKEIEQFRFIEQDLIMLNQKKQKNGVQKKIQKKVVPSKS